MVKMELEFSDEQAEKIEILKSKGIDVGEAIDLLFDIQHEIVDQIEEEGEEGILEKLQNTGFDLKFKAEVLKDNFDEQETYDVAVQDAKHKVKWSEFLRL